MRAIWTGEISFGLVAVPVKLYSATRDLSPRFHYLHKKCGTRIHTVRRCPKCDVDVAWEEVGKGYEVSKGRYALFTKKELAELEAEEAAQGIDIAEFIDPAEVDLAFIEKTYWVGPAGKTTRSYELLRKAMEESERVAVARVKIRSRTRLALLRPREGRFALDMMRFGDELVDAKEIEVPTTRTNKGSAKELDLALDLVKRMSGPFDPTKHPDEYRAAVLSAVEKKETTEDTTEEEPETRTHARGGKVIDLAEILSQSLKGSTAKNKRAKHVKKAHPKRSAHAKAS